MYKGLRRHRDTTDNNPEKYLNEFKSFNVQILNVEMTRNTPSSSVSHPRIKEKEDRAAQRTSGGSKADGQ